MHRSGRLYLAAFASFLLTSYAAANAAPPTITNVSLRGLRLNGSTTLTINGSNLLPEPKLVLPFSVTHKVKPGATAARVEMVIKIEDPYSPSGIHQLRIANANGMSNAVAIGVDDLPQLPFVPKIDSLPVALHGNLAGGAILRTTFAGKQGQQLVVDVEGRRLGSNLKPVLRLYNARGTQLAWSPPKPSIGGDARCELELPADGDYVVEMHDLLYRGANPGYFRLKIGELKYADLALPIGVTRGSKPMIRFASSNISDEMPFDALVTDIRSSTIPAPYPSLSSFSGSRPRLLMSDYPEILEAPAGDKLQAVPIAPVGINGRLASKGEEDQYLLNVTPGQKLRFDVLSQRLGSPLDGVLILRREDGGQLARNDDRNDVSDPGLDFTVPGNVNKIIVALHDLQKRGGDDSVYRIDVRDLSRPDFSLTASTDRVDVPAGGTQAIRVNVARAGYNGPIALKVEKQLPLIAGDVQVAQSTIAPGATVGLLTFTAPKSEPFSGLISITGEASDSPTPMTRMAQVNDTAVTRLQPWLRNEIAVAITRESPIGIQWQVATDQPLLLGSQLSTPIKLTRADGTKGPIRVRLLTTQVIPRKKVKQNNKDVEVDDLDRAIRLIGTTELAEGINEATLGIAVPADLPQREYGLVLVADLLSADKKTVLATNAVPVRTFKAVPAPPK